MPNRIEDARSTGFILDPLKNILWRKHIILRFRTENDQTLEIPIAPIHWKKKADCSRDAGLSGLRSTKVYIERFRIAKSIFPVDREYMPRGENIPSLLEDALRGFGIQIHSIQ
jgi:hypothetical protein